MDAPTPFASPHRWIQAKVVHTTIRSHEHSEAAWSDRLVRQPSQIQQ